MTLVETAQALNTLAAFLALRDIPELSAQALRQRYGISRADVMILFGGSILEGVHVAARAMRAGAAQRLMLVGGQGHTTGRLREQAHAAQPELDTRGMSEASIFAWLLNKRYGITDCLLEERSTNCGNNVSFALEELERRGLQPRQIILVQEAAMQRRMDAGFRKQLNGRACTLINFAAYSARVAVGAQGLRFKPEDLWGMWEMPEYIALLMGEIPRLTDDVQGYGPQGKDFIAHVDVPEAVRAAYDRLTRVYGANARPAQDKFASKP